MAAGRLYHYYFEGIEKPITILATDKKSAREILGTKLLNLPEYADREVDQETTSSLVAGVTRMVKNGKTLVWTGVDWKTET